MEFNEMEELLKKRDESNLQCLARLYYAKKQLALDAGKNVEELTKIEALIEKVEGNLTKKERKALNKAMGRISGDKWTLTDKLKLFEIIMAGISALAGGAAVIVNHEKNKVERFKVESANKNLDRLAEFEQEGSIRTFSGRESAKEALRR